MNGVIREPDSAVPYIKNFIEKIPNSDIDFFLYTSNKTQFNFGNQKDRNKQYNFLQNNTCYINDKDISIYFDNFNIKNHIIEEKYEELKDIVYSNLDHDNAVAWENDLYRPIQQFYGAEKCNLLKQEYEQQNNFKYDVVFRIRPDLVLSWWPDQQYPPKTPEEWDKYIFDKEYQERGRSNQIFVTYIDVIQGQSRIGDNFVFGNSTSLDLFFKNITKNSISYWKDEKNSTIWEGISKYRPAPESLWASQAIRQKNSIKIFHGFYNDVIRCPLDFMKDGQQAIDKLRLLNAQSGVTDRLERIKRTKDRIEELEVLIANCNKDESHFVEDYKTRIKTLKIEIDWLKYGNNRDEEFLKGKTNFSHE